MIKVNDTEHMCFLYYELEIDDYNNETLLKRIDQDYVQYFKSTVLVSYNQFGEYLKSYDCFLIKLYLNDPDFLNYFHKRENALIDDTDYMITTRLYNDSLYNTTITVNTIDYESMRKIKLKHGSSYRDIFYDEDYEVILSFIHKECYDKRMTYSEYKNWVLKN